MARKGENIRKRKDGRWEGRYIVGYDDQGKAKYASVYGKTYLETKRKLNDRKNHAEQKQKRNRHSYPLFEDVLYLWLNHNRIRLKEQTVAKYRQLIVHHIIPSIGKLPIEKVNDAELNRFLLEKKEHGRLDGTGGLSPSYVRTIAFIVKSALCYAADCNYCEPVRGAVVLPSSKKEVLDVLTRTEQAVLEQYLEREICDKKLGILLSLYAGLRIGEVCGIQWSDVNFQNATLHVHSTVERISNTAYTSKDQRTKLVLSDVKTNTSDRLIPIPKNLLRILKEYSTGCDGFILAGTTYPYIDPRSLQYYHRKCLSACSIRYVNYHVLRHTFATRCIESGMDIKSLSEILGHSNVNITLNTYVHSSMEHKRKQLEAMMEIRGQELWSEP